MSLADARAAIEMLRGREFVNRATGIAARLVESRPDRANDANVISIKRFARNVLFGNREAVAWITIKESRQHGHHIYSVEAIKVEALDRKVEVVSGNAPHASSASTGDKITSSAKAVKRAREFMWVAGTILLAIGIGSVVVNIREPIASLKYRELFWGLIRVLLGFLLIYVGLLKKKGVRG